MQKPIRFVFFLLGLLPYIATWPYYPYVTWGSESVTVLLVLTVSILSFVQTKESTQIRLNAFAFTSLALAGFILITGLISPPAYVSYPLIAGTFLLLGALFTVAVDRCQRANIDVLDSYANGLLAASWVQIIFVFLQISKGVKVYNKWVNDLPLWIPHYPVTGANGMFFQRNQLVDFLFVAFLSATFLVVRKRISRAHFYTWVLLCSAVCTLVASRSVFIFALALGAISLIVWLSKRSLKDLQSKELVQFSKVSVLSLGIFILVQFLLKPLFSFIGRSEVHGQLVTGLQRLADTDFSDDRFCIWRKGLIVFKEYPLFGAGWGNFGSQGTLFVPRLGAEIQCQSETYNSNAHNIFIHLLAETGIFGTAIVVCGLGIILYKILRSPWTTKSMLVLGVGVVLLLHSQIEYPLWYAYFFFLLAAMLAFHDASWVTFKVPAKFFTFGTTAFAILLICATVVGWKWHDEIRDVWFTSGNIPLTMEQKQNLVKISQKPILANMADFFILMRMVNPSEENLIGKLQMTERLMRNRPVTYILFQRAVYLTYAGREQEAMELIDIAHRNNADAITTILQDLNNFPMDKRLLSLREKIIQLKLLTK